MTARRFDAVLVDLDNTLYDYAPCHAAGLAALTETVTVRFGISPREAEAYYEAGRHSTKERLQGTAASHHRLLYAQAICERAGRPAAPHALEFEQAYWHAYLASMRLHPGVLDFLGWVRSGGMRLALVTDLVASIQLRKVVALGLSAHLDSITTSEEAGVEKPDAGIFRLAAQKAQAQAARCVMIGDDLRRDVLGAMAFGMEAVWWNPDSRPVPHHAGDAGARRKPESVSDFSSLPELLEQWAGGAVSHA